MSRSVTSNVRSAQCLQQLGFTIAELCPKYVGALSSFELDFLPTKH